MSKVMLVASSKIYHNPAMTHPREKTILIVDDDPATVHMFAYVLKSEGFEIATAGDGQEAIAAIERNRPDLVILDMMMPLQGGYDVVRELQTSENSGIPVIVVTARQADRSMVNMIEQEPNVAGFLKKPVDLPALIFLVHRVLKTERQAPEGPGRSNIK